MSILDKYRNKGYVQIGALSESERDELNRLLSLSKEEQFRSGLRLRETFANLPPGYPYIQLGNRKIIAFESITPEALPKPSAEKKVPFSPMVNLPRPGKSEMRHMIIRYAEAKGIPIKSEKEIPEFSKPQQLRVDDVLFGVTKAALVDASHAEEARKRGLLAFRVPHGSFEGSAAKNNEFVIYRQGNTKYAKDVVNVLKRYPPGKRGVDYLREMGNAMGTPKEQTESFIKTFYGEEGGGTPKWLGVLSVGLILWLLLKK